MAGYYEIIKVKTSYYLEAKKFFGFLQAVGRRYKRPVKINYRYVGRGRFYVLTDGGSGSIDALLQELILNRGLYYYICSIQESKKTQIINNSILPIYQGLLENRFQNPYSKFLKKHILGKISQGNFIPGDFFDPFSHEYEVLFRKWDLGLMNESDFIIDTDSLLTKFMLTKLNHSSGQKSPMFNELVNRIYLKGVGMAKETKKLFNKIHTERTNGLHRLNSASKDKVLELGSQLYNYFQYFDEFQQSQKEKTEKLHGKIFKRIKWGDEKWLDENGKPYKEENGEDTDTEAIFNMPCHDCACVRGQYHCSGCDMEICPRCNKQRIGCSCKLKKDY